MEHHNRTKNVPTNTEIYYPENNGEKLINDDCSILQHIIMFYTTTDNRIGAGAETGAVEATYSSSTTESTGILKLFRQA